MKFVTDRILIAIMLIQGLEDVCEKKLVFIVYFHIFVTLKAAQSECPRAHLLPPATTF